MSGHSKWATTKRQKAVVDAKRGALFTKIGNQILIKAELIEINKRILTFKLEAFDKDILIGEGTHKRCIVNVNKFLGKLN